MREKGKRFITKYGFRLFVFAFLTVVFMLLGRDGPVLFDDSGSYMRIRWHEGVMPAYPILLLLNQYFFGDIWYLWAVILEQALLAAFSVTVFEETVRKRFGLLPVEGVLICLFALYPYTIEMPVVMTQAILTEGIAYSIFYLFLAVLLSAVWDKSYIRFWHNASAFGGSLSTPDSFRRVRDCVFLSGLYGEKDGGKRTQDHTRRGGASWVYGRQSGGGCSGAWPYQGIPRDAGAGASF